MDISLEVTKWEPIISWRNKEELREYVYEKFPDHPDVLACKRGERSNIDLHLKYEEFKEILCRFGQLGYSPNLEILQYLAGADVVAYNLGHVPRYRITFNW